MNSTWSKSTRRGWATGIVGAALLLASVPAMATTTPPPDDRVARASAAVHDSTGSSSSLPDGAVTLLTGDKVVLRDGDPQIVPGPGRRTLTFTVEQDGDRLVVMPSDVAGKVAGGALDERLFDVAWLIRHGYDDARAARLPRRSPARSTAETDHVLTIRHLDEEGRPVGGGPINLFHLEDSQRYDAVVGPDGSVEIPLPAGTYVIHSQIPTEDPGTPQMVHPGLTLDRDVDLTMDARTAKPMSIQVPPPDARDAGAEVGFYRSNPYGDGRIVRIISPSGVSALLTAPLGDPVPADLFTAFAATHWAKPDAAGQLANSPYTYDLVDTQPGQFWHGLERVVHNAELAQFPSRYHTDADGRGADVGIGASVGPVPVGISRRYDLPATVTHFVEPGYATYMGFVAFLEDPQGGRVDVTELSASHPNPEPSRSYPQRWNAAVTGPVFGGTVYGYPGGVERTGGDVRVRMSLFGDGDGRVPAVSAFDSGATRLYRDGALVGEYEAPGWLDVTGLPPEESAYRLVTSADRSSLGGMSIRTDVAWTFRSAATGDRQALPLWLARFHPPVDERNTVPWQPVSGLRIDLTPQPGAVVGTPELVRLQVSVDDGESWTDAVVHRAGEREFVAEVPLTADAQYVSLRSTAVDSVGNGVEQTVIRAYGVR